MREVPRGGWGNIAAMDAEWGNERGGSRTTNCGLPMPSPLLDFQQAGAQKVAKHHPAASSAAAPPWRHPHACRCPSRPTLWHPSWVGGRTCGSCPCHCPSPQRPLASAPLQHQHLYEHERELRHFMCCRQRRQPRGPGAPRPGRAAQLLWDPAAAQSSRQWFISHDVLMADGGGLKESHMAACVSLKRLK